MNLSSFSPTCLLGSRCCHCFFCHILPLIICFLTAPPACPDCSSACRLMSACCLHAQLAHWMLECRFCMSWLLTSFTRLLTGFIHWFHTYQEYSTPFITAYTIVMVSYLFIKYCFHRGWFVLSCPQCSPACFVGSPAFPTADRRPGCPIWSLAILTADYRLDCLDRSFGCPECSSACPGFYLLPCLAVLSVCLSWFLTWIFLTAVRFTCCPDCYLFSACPDW